MSKTYKTNIPIRYWAEEDRPREKLANNGKNTLSDAELIAILLGSGNSDESAVELAKRILNDNKNNLIELAKMEMADLMKYKGIGEAKAITIIAALELGRRRQKSKVTKNNKITTSKAAFEYIAPLLLDNPYETFYLLLLSNANNIIKHIRIGEGGITSVLADIRKIFKLALEHKATSVILCHNHPSGNIQPSKNDILFTEKAVNAGKILDINVLDHIIVGDNNYFSFADENRI